MFYNVVELVCHNIVIMGTEFSVKVCSTQKWREKIDKK